MTDAGYVLAGWSLTGVVLVGYAARLWSRTRRVRRLLGPDERPGVRGCPPESTA